MKRIKTVLEDTVLAQIEKQRIVVSETSDRIEAQKIKLSTIEAHLPVMIQEILEFYFEKRVNDFVNSFVNKDEYKKALSLKLDSSIFRDYEKSVALDRT